MALEAAGGDDGDDDNNDGGDDINGDEEEDDRDSGEKMRPLGLRTVRELASRGESGVSAAEGPGVGDTGALCASKERQSFMHSAIPRRSPVAVWSRLWMIPFLPPWAGATAAATSSAPFLLLQL
mmetsp:Transcript_16757/g.41250  ORF Transcript_16757/g.41250 Transcript_16757/m.41250 type:complete len:124 (+) Transcript_16757:3137-3508(+)